MTEFKTLNMKIPKDLWVFLKKKAMDDGTTMTKLVIKYVEKQKKNFEKKELTDSENDVN